MARRLRLVVLVLQSHQARRRHSLSIFDFRCLAMAPNRRSIQACLAMMVECPCGNIKGYSSALSSPLFSPQCSSASAACRGRVHRGSSLCIELLQRLISLVFHHSPLFEICDLPRRQSPCPLVKPNWWTSYPATGASLLKLRKLRRASLPRLLILFHAVYYAIPIKTLEKIVPALPTHCSC